MTKAFDDRIVQVTLQLANGLKIYQDLAIYAQGTIFASPIAATCNCRIFNLTKENVNYIISQASPLKFPRTPVFFALDVGRESYGTFRMFQGYVMASEVTQPPDIGICLKSSNSNFFQGSIHSVQLSPQVTLLAAAQNLAKNLSAARGANIVLDFQSSQSQKLIDNYSYTGPIGAEMNYLQTAGDINVLLSQDGGTLYVVDADKSLDGPPVLISADTGMVGVPQVDDRGVTVRVMINNAIRVGASITIKSDLNPSANGTYKVVQMNFDVASRDNPFWYILWCSNLAYYQGTVG